MPLTRWPPSAVIAMLAAIAAAGMLLPLAASDVPRLRCNPALAWRPLEPGQPGQEVIDAIVSEAFEALLGAASAPCSRDDLQTSVGGCWQELLGTLYSLTVNLTCPQSSSWSMGVAAEAHANPQELNSTAQVLSLVLLWEGNGRMPLEPAPGNSTGSDYTGARGGCSMIIQDVVMGFTDISTNSEGGFSSIYAEDKDCCFDPAFMADAQAMITSMVNTVYALAKGFNKSADCLVTETWTTELALAHCLLTPADQAALRQAVITHNSSLCPAFYRDAYLKAPLNCRGAIASLADISFPFFKVTFDACQVPY